MTTTRRHFLSTAAGLSIGAAFAPHTLAVSDTASARPCLKKALIASPKIDTLEAMKAAGFDGIETADWNVDMATAKAAAKDADATGMRIHSVLRGWTDFNSPDPEKVDADIQSVVKTLENAALYGADAILLVPCRTGGMPMPQPWDFDIDFDPKTALVTRVAQGDNTEYAAYIAAQNHATETSRRAVEKLIPVAEKTGVVIALENVWNNLWVTPALYAAFVRSFESPWVQTYFDIGNHVKYATPRAYFEALGETIVKLHVKDFRVDRAAGSGGQFVDIRDGDVDWPQVLEDIKQIGYGVGPGKEGWLTIEGSGGLGYQELSRRLDLIIAGE